MVSRGTTVIPEEKDTGSSLKNKMRMERTKFGIPENKHTQRAWK